VTLMQQITDAERRRRLAQRHLLLPSARVERVDAATDALVALHSSDPVSVYLSAAARMNGASLAGIERALYDERSLVRHHAMRRTLWVMTPQVARQAHAAFTRRIAIAERKRTAKLFDRDLGWVDEAIERVVATVAAVDGPIGTREIGTLVPDLAEPAVISAGKSYAGTMSAHTRAVLMAAFEARVARGRPQGTWIASQYNWVAHSDWVDWIDHDLTESEGAMVMVRRWLDRFGPGTLTDIVWWTGATKTLIRRALEGLQAAEVRLDDGSVGHVLPDDLDDTAEPGPWVALLPGLDPTAMGWKQREWYLPLDVAARVTDRNGNIGPTVWVDGRVVGGFVQRPDGSIAHDVDDLDVKHRALLDVEIERLQTLVGASRFTVRFPAPNQAALLAG
jgi:DNA glycosylase AlkZ-like